MKYRCKVTSPWGNRGEILSADEEGDLSLYDELFVHPELYPDLFEPLKEEKPKRWAMAVVKYDNGNMSQIKGPYCSLFEAISDLSPFTRNGTVIWPARFDKDGFLITEEE